MQYWSLIPGRLIHDVPPSEAGQESAADVLGEPEVGGEENGDRDKAHDVAQALIFFLTYYLFNHVFVT